ncbi:carboxylesterase/lipase family protein [Roseateles chitinivorans]|uniref:carboxylesterase/lipase family protein n=1 Tax=Roseateles chitinivorans TaxID=2917965 RepID=UPI003D67C284
MSLSHFFGLAALALSSLAGAATVRVAEGELAGATASKVESFKGVPFAAPPVGDLRWRAPQPAIAWDGVRDARRYGPACMQAGNPWPIGTPAEPQSEDCLFLNVWRPSGVAATARLPVMVWIPGGGWTDGSGSAPLYDGSRLAQRGVIVVTLNYRVGAFGFLAHEALSKENAHGSSGNFGLRDQVAALRWVRDNIGAFGGDAANVTLFGQSAGAMSANLLTVSPPARGLFRRVIGQSGAVFIPPAMAGGDAFRLKGAQAEGARFAQALGAPTLEALRQVPAAAIVEAQRRFSFHFILDHEMLPQEPWAAYAAGRQAPADLLIGWNADEGRLFIADQQVTAATLEKGIADMIGEFPASLRPWYRARTDVEARAARAAFEGDLRMGYDTWTWMRLQARTGQGRVFAYRFDQQPPARPGSPWHGLGATHGAELPYVFDALAVQGWTSRRADQRLATAMADYWTNFAKTGNPNGAGLPRWPRYAPGASGRPPQVMRLGPRIQPAPETGTGALEAMDALFQAARGKDAAAVTDH